MESLNQNINLIPESELNEQQKIRVVKFSSIFSILIFLIIFSVSGYYFLTITKTKKEISTIESNVLSLRSEVTALEDVEVIARNLDKKYSALNTLFSARPSYSLLLQEMRNRTPDGLEIKSLDVRTGTANISGTATSYIAISTFVNNLLNENFSSGEEGLQSLFTEVSLNSVSLEGSVDSVRFYVVVGFNESLLK